MIERLANDGFVLILVLVEYTLEEFDYHMKGVQVQCLNPCFGGIYSRRDEFDSMATKTVLS